VDEHVNVQPYEGKTRSVKVGTGVIE